MCLLLGLGTVALYAPSYYHEFISYDDPSYVTANPHVQAGLTKEGLAWAFAHVHGDQTYWHPLTWLSHMLDCELFGLNSGPPHLVNALFHAINALLLLLVLARLTGANWRSAAVAALFALHPLQVDTVAWVTERKNILTTLFALLSVLAYERYARRPCLSRYWPVPMLFALALMAKPALVMLPCLLLILDFWPLRRFAWAKNRPSSLCPPSAGPVYPVRTASQLLAEKLPLFALALASGLLTLRAHEGLGMTQFDYGLSFGLRLENAAVSYAMYLRKVFWPNDLAIIYPHPGKWPEELVGWSTLLLAAVSGGAVWQVRHRPWIAVGWLWFLVALAPAIGLVQVGVQAMADRFAYVPVVGVFLAVVWGLGELVGRWRHGEWVGVLAGLAALGACLGVTGRQLTHWRDNLALFEHTLRVTRNNYLAHHHAALACLRLGRNSEAREHLVEAIRLKPDFGPSYYSLGKMLGGEQPREAVEYLRMAAQLEPTWALPQKALGDVLTRLGRLEEAKASYASAAKLAPNDPEVHFQLGLLSENHPIEAAAHYRAALRLRPEWPEALNNLAWILATAPQAELRNGREAVRLAEQACALTGRRRAIYVGTLAAAYAEAGQFEEAARAAQEAESLAQRAGDDELAKRNRELRLLYLEGRPFRAEVR